MRRTGQVRRRMTFGRSYTFIVAVDSRPEQFKVKKLSASDVGVFQTAAADLRLRISVVIQGEGAVREDLLVLTRRGV